MDQLSFDEIKRAVRQAIQEDRDEQIARDAGRLIRRMDTDILRTLGLLGLHC